MFRHFGKLWTHRSLSSLFSRGKENPLFKSFCRNRIAVPKRNCRRPAEATGNLMPFFAFSIPFLTKQTPEEEMLSAWVKATDNIQSGNFKTADSYLHTVLKILSEQHERGEITEREYQGKRARVTSEMANVCLMMGEFEKGEKLLKASMKDCVACGLDPKGPVVIEMSLKLAQVMAKTDRKAEAEQGFRFCVDSAVAHLKTLPDVSDEERKNAQALLGITSAAYSKFLHSYGRYSEALVQANIAHEQAIKLYDCTNPNVVSLMGDIGVLHAEMNNLDEAEKVTREAINISEFQPDILLNCLPVLYINLGSILLRRAKLKDAEEMAQQAKRLITLMEKSPSTKSLLAQVDDLLLKLKEKKK